MLDVVQIACIACLNPFSIQVYFYTDVLASGNILKQDRLNPFSIQVYFYKAV